MRRLAFTCLLLSGVLLFAGCRAASVPRAHRGAIDLSELDLARTPASLDGEWELYWSKLLAPGDPLPSPSYLNVPGRFNGAHVEGQKPGGLGYATYRLVATGVPTNVPLALRLDEAHSAARIWINGEKVGTLGLVATTREQGQTQSLSRLIFDVPVRAARFEILIQISNFDHARGGLIGGVLLGDARTLRERTAWRQILDAFLVGGLTSMALYHLAYYLLRRREPATLFFALFCALQGLRSVDWAFNAAGYSSVGWWRFSYLCVYLTPVFLGAYLRQLYPVEFSRRANVAVTVVQLGFCAIVATTPSWIYMQTLFANFILGAVFFVYAFVSIGFAVARRRPHIRFVVVGLVVFFLGVVNDMLFPFSIHLTGLNGIASLGLLFFVLCQALLLATRFSQAYDTNEELAHELTAVTQANNRFVPTQMLDLMGKRSISDVALGDQVAHDMSILFLDIRSFRSLAEGMTNADVFAFVNSILRRIAPHVRRHGGYVDNFIGDAFLALFPRRPEEALDAALAICAEIRAYNEERRAYGKRPVEIGVGIHHGSVTLGTIGDEERMAGTVIADSVNLASRLENLTRAFRARVLVSGAFARLLEDRARYRLRCLGEVRVAGKHQAVELYEALSAVSDEEAAHKWDHRHDFASAIERFAANDLDGAATAFQILHERDPDDGAVAYYVAAIAERKHQRARPSVTGILVAKKY